MAPEAKRAVAAPDANSRAATSMHAMPSRIGLPACPANVLGHPEDRASRLGAWHQRRPQGSS